MIIRLFLLVSLVFLNFFSFFSVAQDSNFLLMPEGSGNNNGGESQAAKSVKNVKKNAKDNKKPVWDTYNKESKKLEDKEQLGTQMASGIMTWDTLINYTAYIVKVLSQMGLLVGAVMIIYAGYLYGVSVFTGDSTKGTGAVKDAIIGVVIVIFSYAFVKILTSMFL